MKKTQFLFAKVKSIDEQARTIDAVASTREMDRQGDIVLPSAFAERIDSFKANPVILATHQHRLDNGSSPVIGSAVPESIRIGDNDVTFTMQFAETVLGEEYWQLYKGKHMRAFSIGFIPLEWTDEKDENLGYIRTYTKIELLEISAVPVPSNRRALVRAKGYFDSDDIGDIAEDIRKEFDARFTKFESKIDDSLDEIKSLLIADRGDLAERLLGVGSEPAVPRGDTDKTEQSLLNSLEKAVKKVVGDKP